MPRILDISVRNRECLLPIDHKLIRILKLFSRPSFPKCRGSFTFLSKMLHAFASVPICLPGVPSVTDFISFL